MFRQFFIVAITEQTSNKKEAELRVIKTSDDSYTDTNIASNLRNQFEFFNSKEEEDYYMVNTEDVYSNDFNFMIENYELPTWLEGINSMSETAIPRANKANLRRTAISAILVLADTTDHGEVMLFQNFSRANVIRPGKWIPLTESHETYSLEKPDILTFANKLTAVYFLNQKKLLFDNYRNASKFLPLEDFSNKVFDFHINEVFDHEYVNDANKFAIVNISNSIIKGKFIKLNRLKTLDAFSLDYLKEKAEKGGIEIPVHNGQIYFPPVASSLRRILSFLTQDILENPLNQRFYEVMGRKKEIGKS